MKLLTRYNRINILLMGSIFVLSSIAFYFALQSVLINEIDESLEVTQTKITDYVKTHNALPVDMLQTNDDLSISYKEIDKKKVHKRKKKTTEMYNQFEEKMENYRLTRFCVKTGDTNYEITIARPMEGIKHLLRNIATITFITLFLIILGATLANRVIFRRLWKPFYDSLTHLKAYKIGAPAPLNLPVTKTDEFNTMNTAIEFAMNKAGGDYVTLKQFTENASHEMQTPLAIVRSKLDLFSQEVDLTEKQSALLEAAQASISRLSRLNKSLLLLAKIENLQFDKAEPIQLDKKLEDKLTLFKEIWQNENIEVTASAEPANIIMDASLCDILLNNLLSNAVNHNYPGGSIKINLSQGKLSVSNTSNAPAADEAQMYRRFYKGQANSTNHGLGLSIIKQICDLNNISIHYHFNEKQHTFVLTWTTTS